MGMTDVVYGHKLYTMSQSYKECRAPNKESTSKRIIELEAILEEAKGSSRKFRDQFDPAPYRMAEKQYLESVRDRISTLRKHLGPIQKHRNVLEYGGGSFA